MVCFGQVAQRNFRKPLERVMRTGRRDEDFPADIAGVVIRKYTFEVTMSNQSYYTLSKSYVIASHEGNGRFLKYHGWLVAKCVLTNQGQCASPYSKEAKKGTYKDLQMMMELRNTRFFFLCSLGLQD